ncbi:GP3 [Olivier's shrew virus 1]|uniref:GP3 n=1 Tax=Olivier's shrew virus 1 TaxID=2012619 RepID=A0A1Z2RX57_9NIDO|nr:GP3 [Olivier's shrew virus 1]ASA49505.1 GP3 [Olivier's shrew virus 1]
MEWYYQLCSWCVVSLLFCTPGYSNHGSPDVKCNGLDKICFDFTGTGDQFNASAVVDSHGRYSNKPGWPDFAHAMTKMYVDQRESGEHDVQHQKLMEKMLLVVALKLSVFPNFWGSRNGTITHTYINLTHLCWCGHLNNTFKHYGELSILDYKGIPFTWLFQPFYCAVLVFGCAKALRGVSPAT